MDVTEAPPRHVDRRPPQGARRAGRVSPRVKRVVALVVALLAWEVGSRAGVVDPFYAPPPTEVADVLGELFATGDIYRHLQATFTAALGGLILGVVVGGALGLAAALVRTASELLEPVMMALNAVPRVILAPLFMIWFGIGIGSKVALSFLLVSVLMFSSVFSGIKQADQRLVERIRSFGGGTWWLVRDVYWPSVTAWVMSNLKVAVGFAFTGAVVGEFVASTKGLGYLLSFAQSQFNTPLVFALITLVMVFVLTLLGAAGWLERRLLRWRDAS